MSSPTYLTSEAIEGYTSPTGINPYLYSSPSWYAWSLGDHMSRYGMTPPKDVRMSRGSKMWANDLLFVHAGKIGWARI